MSRRTPGVRRGAGTGVLLAFTGPALALLVLTRLAPEGFSLVASFEKVDPFGGASWTFAGWDNFRRLFTSAAFWQVLGVTVWFVVLASPVIVVGSLFLAWLYTRTMPMRGFWRTVAFLPSAIPSLGLTVMWGVALKPTGVMNNVLEALGLPAQGFYSSTAQALPTIALITAWGGVGYWMVFLIAGLLDIPREVLEAARMDGASPWREFFSVVVPLLRRPLLFVLVANTVWVFQIYAPIQVLTNGGPSGATSTLMFDTVRTATVYSNQQQAMAQMVVLLVLLGATVAAQFALLGERE
ncbi:carbohydrate ABC transporter permease [Streptomyces shenzhenensis]|uniref:carbohydrate ABC transporter permease n=1 Tax=Streptomyces shenzhenensis TaxID=943815 RepID=UPI00367DA43E